MGLKLLLSIGGLSLLFSTANALECPNVVAKCDLQIVNANGGNELTLHREGKFKQVNNDEPSLPPNECELDVSMSAQEINDNVSLNFHVNGDLRGYFNAFGSFGAVGPQYEVEDMTLKKKHQIYYNKKAMICSLE